MNALKAYRNDDSGSDLEEEVPMEEAADPEEVAKRLGLDLNPVTDIVPFASSSQIAESSKVAVYDPQKKEIGYNPKYQDLFKPEVCFQLLKYLKNNLFSARTCKSI